jgi:hypothetical protein
MEHILEQTQPQVKINMNREYRQSFHVRLRPSPPLILNTSTAVADRLEVSPSIGPSAGTYRRVSAGFISTLASEIAAEPAGSDRLTRLQEILTAAQSTPGVGDDDLGNFPTPDLSWY